MTGSSLAVRLLRPSANQLSNRSPHGPLLDGDAWLVLICDCLASTVTGNVAGRAKGSLSGLSSASGSGFGLVALLGLTAFLAGRDLEAGVFRLPLLRSGFAIARSSIQPRLFAVALNTKGPLQCRNTVNDGGLVFRVVQSSHSLKALFRRCVREEKHRDCLKIRPILANGCDRSPTPSGNFSVLVIE